MRYERHSKSNPYNVWFDLEGNCYLDSEDWALIYFLNDLENEEFKNFDLAQ